MHGNSVRLSERLKPTYISCYCQEMWHPAGISQEGALAGRHRLDGGLARRLDIEFEAGVGRGRLREDIWPELKEPLMLN